MKKAKAFDCVAMKDDIQQKLYGEWQGLKDDDVIRRIRDGLRDSGSPLAKWWRQISKPSKRLAEKAPVLQ